ncbi:MAG: response regulator transcription factor, partial [Verrucomicrobiota bacterium]
MSEPITVGIVEDSAAFRTRLKDFINASDDLRCICTCADGASAIADLPAQAPHVVLMDLQLPDCSGVDCTHRLKSALPQTEFMIFTVHEDSEQIFKALTAGASGYLLKRTPPAEVLIAIRELHRGGAPMSSEIARKVVQYFRHEAPKPTKPSESHGLSPRQEEILKLLAQGHVPKEIADKLGITIETVRSYLKLI